MWPPHSFGLPRREFTIKLLPQLLCKHTTVSDIYVSSSPATDTDFIVAVMGPTDISTAMSCHSDQKESCIGSYPSFSVPSFISLSLPWRPPPATVVQNRHRYCCVMSSRCTWSLWCHPCHILFCSLCLILKDKHNHFSPRFCHGRRLRLCPKNKVRFLVAFRSLTTCYLALCISSSPLSFTSAKDASVNS